MILSILCLQLILLQSDFKEIQTSDSVQVAFEALNLRILSILDSAEVTSIERQSVLDGLVQLEEACADSMKNVMSRQAFDPAHTLDVEPKNDPVFGGRVVLPAEKKEHGAWHFQWHKLDILPQHLWMYALTFRGERTLRINKVHLYFRDGSSKLFDMEATTGSSNGQAFRKETWLPFFSFTDTNNPYPRRLKAVHILGSAQDGAFPAKLDFLFRIPDPNPKASLKLQSSFIKMREIANRGTGPEIRSQFEALRGKLELAFPGVLEME